MIETIRRLFARVTPSQRRFGLGCILLLTLGAAALLAMTGGGEDGNGGGGSGQGSTLQSPSAVFAARSPGARLAGALYQIKEKLVAGARKSFTPVGPRPTERVFSVVRVRPARPLMLVPDNGPYSDFGPLALFDSALSMGNYAAGPAFEVPGFSFGDVPVAPSGGSEQPGGPSPGPAVPETATWLMMVAGVGIAGGMLRRRSALAAMRSQQLAPKQG